MALQRGWVRWSPKKPWLFSFAMGVFAVDGFLFFFFFCVELRCFIFASGLVKGNGADSVENGFGLMPWMV